MLIKPTTDIRSSEITPKDVYLNRRNFLAGLGLSTVAAAGLGMKELLLPSAKALATDKIAGIQKSQFSTTEKITPINDVSHYNNYYEFSTEKEEPAKMAKDFRTRPWSITIDGAVPKKQKWDIDAIMKFAAPEERIYRHRCVEGWSIVVPWVGFSLSELIKRAESLGKAKFVQFTSILDMTQMPGQRQRILDWPYTEGLRMDEAMHPLTLLCFGMYGESLPNQDGAPIRLVVPWKYGFKSAKAIVKISFTDHQPSTTWNEANPHDFGFYSNVNPNVDRYHSQAHERRLGEFRPRPTLMFNGYDQVAGLYSGMDLAKNY
ncbi:MAG: mononuclear molybdenum enzyme YedY [Acidobacteria bacterium 13_1_20CM_4_56_7]|jgi:sulfoxide reductase catalytic subunit YedY|nr:MAG: mononuclear molybdenum enzyme YedY [Acidobacteria bacterium 13_1_20CM_4_56_7]